MSIHDVTIPLQALLDIYAEVKSDRDALVREVETLRAENYNQRYTETQLRKKIEQLTENITEIS